MTSKKSPSSVTQITHKKKTKKSEKILFQTESSTHLVFSYYLREISGRFGRENFRLSHKLLEFRGNHTQKTENSPTKIFSRQLTYILIISTTVKLITGVEHGDLSCPVISDRRWVLPKFFTLFVENLLKTALNFERRFFVQTKKEIIYGVRNEL